MTKQEILAMTGLSEPEFYAQYPTQEAFQMAMGGMVEEYKKGGWIQKATASIKRRGTEGVCTGSNFGGPSCRPGTKRYALAKTFRKMAKARKKEDGGEVEMYEDGGDTNSLMSIPESQRFPSTPQPTVTYPEGYWEYKIGKTNSNIPLNFMGQPFATGAIEESVSPLDLIGGVRGGVGLIKGLIKYGKAMKPNYIQIGDKLFDMGAHPRAVRRAVNQMHKGAQKLVLPNAFEDGGKIPDNILRSRLESHMSPAEAQDYIDSYAQGGVVDVYQLMGMPTPEMYGMGAYAPIGKYSHVMSRKNVPNMGMAYGGMVPAYKKGGFLNTLGDIGYGIADVGLGAVGSVTGIKSMQDIIDEDQYSDDKFDNVTNTIGKVGGTALKIIPVTAPFAAAAGAVGNVVNKTAGIDAKNYDPSKHTSSWDKIGDTVEGLGGMASMAMGNIGGAANQVGQLGKAAEVANKITKGASMANSGLNFGNSLSQGQFDLNSLMNIYGGLQGLSTGFAMGGQVNYPEGLQMADGSYVPMMSRPITDRMLSNRTANRIPTFAMGGQTEMTEGELEVGENLNVQKNGSWKTVTKYESGGMGRHSEDGSPKPEQVVPLPVGGSIASRRFKKLDDLATSTNDELLKNTLHGYKHNGIMFPGKIEIAKRKKEAKEQQLAMLEEQKAAKAMNRMVAKYGGAIQRMYAQGGMVPKYQDASWVTGDEGFDFATQGQAPLSTASNYWSEGSIGPATNTGLWNLFNTFTNNPARPNTNILNTPTQPRVAGAPFTGQGPLKTQVYNPTYNTGLLEGIPKLPMSMTEMSRQTPSYTPSPAVQGTEGFKSSSAGGTGYTPSPSAIQGSANAGGGAGMGTSQMDKYLMAAQFLPAAYNIGRGLFEKAWQPGTYETPADLKWEDMTGEAGRRNMLRAYNLAKYNARQIGGSGALAALQAGSTGYQQNLADYEEALENRNKLGRAEVNRLNKAIQQANMQMRMQRDYLAQQAREQKAGMVGAGIEGIGQGAGQLWQNKQMMDALRMAYPPTTNINVPSINNSSYTSADNRTTAGIGGFKPDTSIPELNRIRAARKFRG